MLLYILIVLGLVSVGALIFFGMVQYLLIGLSCLAIILIGLQIAFFYLHPGWQQIIAARIFGRTLIYGWRAADKRLVWLTGKYEHGDIKVGKYGSFTPDPDEVYISEGVPSILAHLSYSRTINPKALVLIKKIKELGKYKDKARDIKYSDAAVLELKGKKE